MTDTNELRRQRDELTTELTALQRKREQAFRVNSDALARQHAGVTHSTDAEMSQFAGDEVAGDDAMTDLRRRIGAIDLELDSADRGKRRGIMQRLRK